MSIQTPKSSAFKSQAAAKAQAAPAPKVKGASTHKTKMKSADAAAMDKAYAKKKAPSDAEREKMAKFIKKERVVRCGPRSAYFRRLNTKKGTPSAFKAGFDKAGKFYMVDMEKARAAKAKSGGAIQKPRHPVIQGVRKAARAVGNLFRK